MNIKTLWRIGTSIIRTVWLKIRHGSNFCCKGLASCSLPTRIEIEKTGKVVIGNHLSSRKNLEIIVRNSGKLVIGEGVNFNNDCSITCRNNIEIGDNVIFGPNCKVFDHDHDYKKTGADRRKSTISGDIIIGNGVWFGANCVVLRNTYIGDNCVFAAGSIVKGNYDSNTLVIQKKMEERKVIGYE